MWKKDGGTWRQVVELWKKDATAWRDIQEKWINVGGTWRQVFLKAGALVFNQFTPSAPQGTCNHFGGGCSANVSCTASVFGGAGSPTYNWTYVSGVSFVIANGTTDTANFEITSDVFSQVGVYKCTIIDGAESVNSNVTITLKHIDLS